MHADDRRADEFQPHEQFTLEDRRIMANILLAGAGEIIPRGNWPAN